MSCFSSWASFSMLPVHALADQLQNLGGGADPDVGADERVFELFEQVGVDLFAAREGGLELSDQARARLLDAVLEPVEQ